MKSLVQKTLIVALVALGLGGSIGGCASYRDSNGHHHYGWRHHQAHFNEPGQRN